MPMALAIMAEGLPGAANACTPDESNELVIFTRFISFSEIHWIDCCSGSVKINSV